MSDQDLRREMLEGAKEPLLPIEKKLIIGSLALGSFLLAVLAILSHLLAG
jgi:hypothetical protein